MEAIEQTFYSRISLENVSSGFPSRLSLGNVSSGLSSRLSIGNVSTPLTSRVGVRNVSRAISSRGDLSRVFVEKALPSRGKVCYTFSVQKKARGNVGNRVERRLVSRGKSTIPVASSLSSRARIFDSVYGALFL